MKNDKVIVLGDLNLDVFARVPGDRSANQEIRTTVNAHPGGAGGNFARTAANEGASVVFVGCVGSDIAGDILLRSLQECNIELHVRRTDELPTGTIVTLSTGAEKTMLCSRGANDGIDEGWIDESLFQHTCHLHISGYSLLSESQTTVTQKAIQIAKKTGLTVSADPPPANLIRDFGAEAFARQISEIDWIFPNLEEGKTLTGKQETGAIIDSLSQSFEVGALTLGKNGSAAWQGNRQDHQGTTPLVVSDTTGSGDAFCAGFVVSFLSNGNLSLANKQGNAAARSMLKSRSTTKTSKI